MNSNCVKPYYESEKSELEMHNINNIVESNLTIFQAWIKAGNTKGLTPRRKRNLVKIGILVRSGKQFWFSENFIKDFHEILGCPETVPPKPKVGRKRSKALAI